MAKPLKINSGMNLFDLVHEKSPESKRNGGLCSSLSINKTTGKMVLNVEATAAGSSREWTTKSVEEYVKQKGMSYMLNGILYEPPYSEK